MRKDTDAFKQAQNYQLMLDLGESMDSLAEKTGFSTATIRNRMKLLELDEEKYHQAEQRGATMTDYLKLNQLSSQDLKNKVLDAVGTVNFAAELDKAKSIEKKRAYMKKVEDAVKTCSGVSSGQRGVQAEAGGRRQVAGLRFPADPAS